MVTSTELVREMERVGAVIGADGVKAPREAWTPTLRRAVEQHQPVLRLLYRIRIGQRWLTEQYERFLGDDPTAAGDDLFSKDMDTWDRLERELREKHGYVGCVQGQPGSCPRDAPSRCLGCGPMGAAT